MNITAMQPNGLHPNLIDSQAPQFRNLIQDAENKALVLSHEEFQKYCGRLEDLGGRHRRRRP